MSGFALGAGEHDTSGENSKDGIYEVKIFRGKNSQKISIKRRNVESNSNDSTGENIPREELGKRH